MRARNQEATADFRRFWRANQQGPTTAVVWARGKVDVLTLTFAGQLMDATSYAGGILQRAQWHIDRARPGSTLIEWRAIDNRDGTFRVVCLVSDDPGVIALFEDA